MTSGRFSPWRALFILGGALVITGGSMHPGGDMRDMLADPKWIPGHSLMALAFVALAAGLALFHRGAPAGRTRWWARAAAVMMVLEAVEMSIHTLAYVDADALSAGSIHAGAATPVLATHLWMATLVYPLTGVALIGLIWAGMREHTLGSRWFGWLGMLGAVAHGAVMPLVFVLGLLQFGILFPMIIFMALWFILAGVWPVRAHNPVPVAAAAPPEAVHPAV
jgi:hypothetical protein